MTTVTVLHAKRMADGRMYDPLFDDLYGDEKPTYKKVAEVEVPDGSYTAEALNVAFRNTNHVDGAWWDLVGVTRFGSETRSSMVGDVFVVGGEAHMVDSVGFKSVETPEF